jgi:hypothetical protein
LENRDSGDSGSRTSGQSQNRDNGNRLPLAASLVKPLIPHTRISEIAQKIRWPQVLALRDILKSSKMVATIAVK